MARTSFLEGRGLRNPDEVETIKVHTQISREEKLGRRAVVSGSATTVMAMSERVIVALESEQMKYFIADMTLPEPAFKATRGDG